MSTETDQQKKYVIRCRGIIMHEGKLLVVRHHVDATFVALPGGHLEWGETVLQCIEREIIEELGVRPEIGRLLYINTFIDKGDVQPMEFFFEIKNGADYVDVSKLERTHAFELIEMIWISPTDEFTLLPKAMADDFRAGKMGAQELRYIGDGLKK